MARVTRRVRAALGAYPELAAVLAAVIIGLCRAASAGLADRPSGHQRAARHPGLRHRRHDRPGALRRLAQAWRRVARRGPRRHHRAPRAVLGGRAPGAAGPLRDGVLVAGLAPCEIASVATTALAGGEAAVAAGVLIGSTLATVTLAAPILTLEAGRASFSPSGVIANLAVVVALPLAAGIAARCLDPGHGPLPGDRPRADGRLSHRHRRGRRPGRPGRRRGPPVCFVRRRRRRAGPVPRRQRRRRPRPRRAVRPAGGAALLLTTSMRDFAIAAALAAAAFGPRAAAPLGLYGVFVLVWGTGAAGFLRARASRPARGHRAGAIALIRGASRTCGAFRTAPWPACLVRSCLVRSALSVLPRPVLPCSTPPWPAMLVADEPHRRGMRRWSWGSSQPRQARGAQLHVGDERHAAARRHDRRELRPHGRRLPRPPRPGRRPGRRCATATRSSRTRSTPSRTACSAKRHRQGRPGRHLVTEPGRVDRHPVRHRQDRRHPRQHQPRLPHQRA